jgi:hypothetical protein
MALRSSTFAWALALAGGLALGSLAESGCRAAGTTRDGDGGSAAAGTNTQGTGGDAGMGMVEGGSAGAEACAAETFPGTLVPLDLFVMLDHSSSMSDGSKWSSVSAAMKTFVASADSAGIGVGLQYFPTKPSGQIPGACNGANMNDPICGLYGPCLPVFNVCGGSMSPNDSCDPVDYSVAEIDIAVLPGVQAAIESSLANHGPTGDSTPSQPAMEGAVTYATAWAQSHQTHITLIVFATDGEPTNCSYNSVDGTAKAAAQAANGAPPVKTFVIGVGSELTSLNQIAQAGGTDQAFLVDTSNDVTQQFIDALNEIRASGQCKFQIPVPEKGEPDYDHVNVALVDPNDKKNTKTVLYVGSEPACDPVKGGWYYDDPDDPKMILLCPATCDEVQLSGWSVEVLLGCKTIVK